MRWCSYLLVSCLCLVFTIPVFAETIEISSSSDWLSANAIDDCNISVTVKDVSGNPVEGLFVYYSVDNSSSGLPYGSFLNSPTYTDHNGIASCIFETSYISGIANITASVTTGNGTFQNSTRLNIDHDTPYSIQFLSFPNNAVVGSIQNIILRMEDIHGNIIDNRKNPEYVTFSIITPDESKLWNNSELSFTNIEVTIGNNKEGWVITNISLDSIPGQTQILVTLQNISGFNITIDRFADGEPFYIRATRKYPGVPFVPANGEDSFIITYELYDRYWNLLLNKVIDLEVTPPGEPWYPNVTATYNGLAAVRYGPYINPFTTNLIATARENQSVQTIIPVEFYDQAPCDLLLSISPMNMPSLDVNETSKAIISAKVIDSRGKGVENETVYFSISSSIYSVEDPEVLEGPYIQTTSAITQESGIAYVTFIPGRFNEWYRPITGTCTVTATWNGRTKTVTPEWKNYGLLRVSTYVSDIYLTVNQTVNISSEIVADGPSSLSKPIDMILCTDRGSSMLMDTYEYDRTGSNDKMWFLYNHSNGIFNRLIQCPEGEQCDRAGLVSFGPGFNSTNWPRRLPGDDVTSVDDASYIETIYPGPYFGYEDFATINTGLEYEFEPLVQNEIQSLRPFGDPWRPDYKRNVPLRYGLYKAINEMIGLEGTPARPNATRAIVVLTDPEWNDWGDPSAGWDGVSVKSIFAIINKAPWELAESSLNAWVPFTSFGRDDGNGGLLIDNNVQISDPLQNMGNYANEHNIIIYVIVYPKRDVNIETAREQVLWNLANSTGGIYFEARDGASLAAIFEAIGVDLHHQTGTNATAVFNLSEIRLNNITYPGSEVFDYLYIENTSTRISKWNSSGYLLYDINRDDTQSWITSQTMFFDLGEMYSGDRWIANFTLLSKASGVVELFENSDITFSGEDIIVPEPFILVQPTPYDNVPPTVITPNFIADITSGNLPLTVHFYDISTGSPTSWNWDFGDGTTSTERDPIKIFSTAGVYDVTLNVSNVNYFDGITKGEYIRVDQTLISNFTANQTVGCSHLTIQFTDSSDGSPESWTWDFGDGTSSNERNPIKTYSNSGVYNVTLNVSNTEDSYEITKDSYISVSEKPNANFTSNQTAGHPPFTIQLNDTSTGSPETWEWDFGDGTSSNDKDPIITYYEVGTYTVSLNVSNDCGNSLLVRNDYVIASPPPEPPTAIFSFSPTLSKTLDTVTFTDISIDPDGIITNWSWDFADGNISTEKNPTHIFSTAGTYSVTLIVTDNDGLTGTTIQTVVVREPTPPVASFKTNASSGKTPLAIQFTDTSTNTPTSWNWNFGDSTTSGQQHPDHVYTDAGTYSVTLTVSNDDGEDTITITDCIQAIAPTPPVASFKTNASSGKTPLAIQFTDTSTNTSTSWNWNFGDSTTSGQQHPDHVYTDVGTYSVTLTVANDDGEDTITITDCIQAIAPTPPIASFSANVTDGFVPLTIGFKDESIYAATWAWEFGDDIVSTEQHPVHTYTIPGIYQVNLTVTNDDGLDRREVPGFITARIPPPPTADFTQNATSGTAPLTIEFTDTSIGEPTSWLWEFGDGIVSDLQHPVHTYSVIGVYTVSLTATNPQGSDTATKVGSVTVLRNENQPVAAFTWASPAFAGVPVQFTDASTGSITGWDWRVGSSIYTIQNPVHTFTAPGDYLVTLRVKGSSGGWSPVLRQTITVLVPDIPLVTDFEATPTTGKVPLNVQFIDRSAGAPTSWQWDFNSDGKIDSTKQNPTYKYTSTGTFAVRLTVKDASGKLASTEKTNFIIVTQKK